MPGFETPFSESRNEEFKTSQQEQMEVVDVEFQTDRDMITYRKKFDDGSVGNWQELPGALPNQPEAFIVKKKRLRRELGLEG